jgi:hypothetical protein
MKTQTKHCKKCDTTKTVDQFHKNRSSKDGLGSKCKDCYKTYYVENREERLAYKKSYYEENREEVLAKKKVYCEENREKINAWWSNKRATDPTFRWVRRTRCRLHQILLGKGSNQPALDLLGCTGQEYRDHLESKWTEGMNWDNYGKGEGKWQVDHIIPVSSFDQSDPEQRKICWNFSNTQPLWIEDNMAKGAKLPTESTNEQK